jgi:hypothetical protein
MSLMRSLLAKRAVDVAASWHDVSERLVAER